MKFPKFTLKSVFLVITFISLGAGVALLFPINQGNACMAAMVLAFAGAMAIVALLTR